MKVEKVLICNDCKSFWISPIESCNCGCKTFSETNEYNACLAKNIIHNNGWIKIESEYDLPKDSWSYWVFRDDSEITTLRDYVADKNSLGYEINITHYQPIEKPKLPIY